MDSLETNGIFWTIILLAIAIGLIPFILFLLTQQNTLKAIKPQNRSMEPGMVWLQLIPLFSLVWQFIVVSRIAESIKREFNSWGSEDSILGYSNAEAVNIGNELPTYSIGIAYCVLFCCSIVPLLGGLASIAGLICWIIYWIKLAEFKRQLAAGNAGRF